MSAEEATGASAVPLRWIRKADYMRLSSFLCRVPRLLRLLGLAVFAAAFFVLVAPGCGRSSLEIDSLDAASPEGGACGPSNCPNGCCDRLGTCRIGADTQACGSRGAQCSDCIANGFQFCDVPKGKVCARSVTNCGPGECPAGCCAFEGGQPTCLAGTDPSACGRFGGSCNDCAQQGRSCDTVTRACSLGKCDATNCKGCCVGDQCLGGNDSQACGSLGESCKSCKQTGQSCAPSPNGAGGRCEGTPTCGPQNCGGCCNDITCVAGSDSVACGKQGQACTNCTATGRQCVAQGLPNERTCQAPVLCGAGNCPGCCVGNNCIVATTPAACGKGGEVCKGCGANETCNAGLCVPAPSCSPANCAGCCIGNDICAIGNQNTACGLAGIQCNNCAGQGKVCQGGSCQTPACGPGNCAGCCAGNTCVLGSQDTACGQNGAQCNDCTPANQVCQGRVCRAKCSPANCAGCCTPGNACAVGFTNSACGSGGDTCKNCTLAASTCDTLALPRVCANQANLCPKPYANCPAGTTTGITPSLQNLCDNVVDLDSIAAACAGGADVGTCVAAFQVLAATNPACAACLKPFDEPFSHLSGVYRCAAPFVNAACNRSTGCVTDCQGSSCSQCPAASEEQCRTQVDGAGGQCNPFVQQTGCVGPAVAFGSLCSPATYGGNFGGWIRAVGAHFCGNGP